MRNGEIVCTLMACEECPVYICDDGSAVQGTPPDCRTPSCPETTRAWFSIDPIQCRGNAWEQWISLKDISYSNEEALVTAWLREVYQIKVYDFASHTEPDTDVCKACSCPRGDTIAVLIDPIHRTTMDKLGWEEMNIAGCTEELKKCDDGSFVGRSPPFCDFDDCPLVNVCPSDEELKKYIFRCKNAGLDYKFYTDSRGCRNVECVKPPRPECPDLEKLIRKCKARGMDYQIVDQECITDTAISPRCDSSCPTVICIPRNECPTDEELEEEIAECLERNMDYEKYRRGNCTYIKCVGNEPPSNIVMCKKYIVTEEYPTPIIGVTESSTGEVEVVTAHTAASTDITAISETELIPTPIAKRCVVIVCDDGYRYNSCRSDDICRNVKCRTYIDEEGCRVKKCNDGTMSRSCPSIPDPIECKEVKLDNGCIEKVCSDGTASLSCPPREEDCKKYQDENGCIVKECEDGYKIRDCPEPEQNEECKVFTDENGCKIKECDNGFVSSDCLQQKINCKVERDEDGCLVKICENGYEGRNCPNKESVECRSYEDDEGCNVTACTDGKEDKNCPGTADSEPIVERARAVAEEERPWDWRGEDDRDKPRQGQPQPPKGILEMLTEFLFGTG